MASNLARRIGFAIVAIPLALLVVWNGGWPLAFVVAIAAVLGVRELYALAAGQGTRALTRTGLISAAVIPLATYQALSSPDSPAARGAPYWVALWLMATLSLALWRRPPGARPLASVAITILGVAYAAVLPSFLLGIRQLDRSPRSWQGAWLVFFPLVITWVCDTAAMFAGKLIGGPKLAPTVSPGKTWAGSLAGVAGGLLAVPVLNALVLDELGVALPPAQGLCFAFVLSVAGQVGDLVESLFKREAGVKDSSALIPGHGGVLDRLDSLYFVLPAAAAMYRLFGVA